MAYRVATDRDNRRTGSDIVVRAQRRGIDVSRQIDTRNPSNWSRRDQAVQQIAGLMRGDFGKIKEHRNILFCSLNFALNSQSSTPMRTMQFTNNEVTIHSVSFSNARDSLHMLGKEPSLQLVGADDIGDEDVIGPQIAADGGTTGHCSGFE